jgi:hypothetical protein
MPTTTPIWTLNASGITPAGSAGEQKLAGCHITQNSAGTAYEFTKPNINEVLATSGPPLPTLPFTFPTFAYKDLDWNITVSTLPSGANGSGTWNTPGSGVAGTAPESGDYTAQSGSGVDADAAASSAKV